MIEWSHQKKNAPQVIAIASGKGGVGKTFITVNLASAICKMGKKVLVLDGDFGLANVNLLMGEQAEKNLQSVFNNECSLDEILLPTTEGFYVIPSGRGCPSMSQLHISQLTGLITAMDNLKEIPDVLVIDTAGTISMEELRFISMADNIVIVITPDLLSLQDASEYIRQLYRIHHIQYFYIIANKAKNKREVNLMMEKLQNLVGFDVDVVLNPLGNVSQDENIDQSIGCISTVVETNKFSKVAKEIIKIAKKIYIKSGKIIANGRLSFFYAKKISEGEH